MLSQLHSEQDLCDGLARQVSDLTYFNRVLVYRFDGAGHGTVLSEENDGSLPSYLGLRFPASDIPKQARDLYILSTVRIIPDASYIPSPLHIAASLHKVGTPLKPVPIATLGIGTPLDLSNSMLSIQGVELELNPALVAGARDVTRRVLEEPAGAKKRLRERQITQRLFKKM